MSLAETRELLAVMQELVTLLKQVETTTTKLTNDLPRGKETLTTFRQLERLALRWLVISKNFGLPEDIKNAVDQLAQVIVTIRMLQMSMNMMMSTNPFTVAIGLTGMFTTAISITSLGNPMEGY